MREIISKVEFDKEIRLYLFLMEMLMIWIIKFKNEISTLHDYISTVDQQYCQLLENYFL